MRPEWVNSDTVHDGAARAEPAPSPLHTASTSAEGLSSSESIESLRLPAVVGPYQLIRKLGQGGMGAVYEAVHRSVERHVAIKFLRPHLPGHDAVARLLKEARATNRVKHPGLIEVSDSGVLADGTPYIVMELLRGETLGRRLRQLGGQADESWALHIAWQLASTLAATHRDGIIHRDIKPENIMLVPDELAPWGERVKVLDFGLAKLRTDVSVAATQSQQVMGTPLYMSPEQCRGAGRIDEKTDVYSLGVVLYQMLCGRPPFIGAGIGELIHQHLGATPPPLSALVPQLRPDTAALVERLLRKSAAERPTMQQVVVELTELQSVTDQAEESRRELARSSTAPARDEVKGLLANLLGAEPEPESDSASTSKSQQDTDVKWQPRATPRAQPASQSSPAEAASRRLSRLLYAGGLLCLLGLGGFWGGSRSRGSHANADAGAFPKNVGAVPMAPKVDSSPQASSPRQPLPSATTPALPQGMEQPLRRVQSARAASPVAVPAAQATPPPAPPKRPESQRPVFRIIDD